MLCFCNRCFSLKLDITRGIDHLPHISPEFTVKFPIEVFHFHGKKCFTYLFSAHNTTSLTRYEQECLMRLCFEGYFSHHRGDGRSISRNVDLLIILVHDVINLLCYCHWRFSFFIIIIYNFKCSQLLSLLFSFNKMNLQFLPVKNLNHSNTNWTIENYFQSYTVISTYRVLKLFETTKLHLFRNVHSLWKISGFLSCHWLEPAIIQTEILFGEHQILFNIIFESPPVHCTLLKWNG